MKDALGKIKFNIFLKNATGVDDVTHVWFGNWNYEHLQMFGEDDPTAYKIVWTKTGKTILTLLNSPTPPCPTDGTSAQNQLQNQSEWALKK